MDAWLAQHFFNPAFAAAGAALVASPIIIHLINRMRFRRVRFAAMEFLLQSQQRNRRRVLIEQLLLLLLRILIVLLLVALIARLILDPNEMSIFHGAKSHHVVLLDDSGSMRDRLGETTAFEDAIDVVKKLVAEGARRPDTQKFSLLLLSNPEQPLFSQRDVNDVFIAELETKLENVRCSHRLLDLVAGFEAARKLLAEEKVTVKHLHVISDYRKVDWTDQKALGSVATALDSNGVTLNFVRTVDKRNQNVAVTRLEGDLQIAATGVPVRFTVAVENFGDQVANDVRLTVTQDGQRLPLSIQFEKIEAGKEVEKEFDISFNSPKKHRLEVALANDALPQDNQRFLALDVSVQNKVLIIDGVPSRDEGSYLADALAADPDLTGFAPQIETVDYLRRPLEEFQSIFILNVGDIPATALEPLENYVAGGGGLAWFLGDAVRPAFYNDSLHKEGKGLFPIRISTAPRELSAPDSSNPAGDVVFANISLFRIFQGQENSFAELTRVYKYFPVASDWTVDDQKRNDGVTTIAVLRDKHPLMFVHKLGDGKVVTCLTSCGPSWNNWSIFPSFVVLQLELQKYIARTDRVLERRIVGEVIRESLDPAQFTETVEVTAPDAAGKRTTRLKAAPVVADPAGSGDGPDAASDQPKEAVQLVANYRDTDSPGVYVVKLLDHDQIPTEKWIAYNVPMEESELELATDSQIRKQIGDDVSVQIQQPGSFQWIAGKDAGQEVREWLLILIVLFLVAEQMLAFKLSYHPKLAGASA